MRLEGEVQRVTVYIGSSDTWHGQNLAMAIVEGPSEAGDGRGDGEPGDDGIRQGVAVSTGHTSGLSEDLPERIEIVDRPERIAGLLPILEEMVGGGLIVLEEVQVIRYLHDPKDTKS